jgi:glutathione S-transferase
MIKLYDSAFSPFARKVRMVLDHKALDYETIDGLLKSNHGALAAVNGRIEVPALMDGDVVVVNSPDIVAYLEHRYPQMPVYPQEPAARVHARAWERLSDTFVDPIFVDISYWKWAERSDQMPQGLLEAARADLRNVYDALDKELAEPRFRQRDIVGRGHCAVSAPRERQGDGGRIFSGGVSASCTLVQADARAADLRRRSAADPRLCGQSERPRFRTAADLLARRSHRMAFGARLPRLVL